LNQHPYLYVGEWDTRHPEAQSVFLVRDGKVQWQTSVPLKKSGNVNHEFDDITMLSNGNIAYACMSGDWSAYTREVDQSGKIIWQLSKNELPEIELKFMTEMQYLSDGDWVLTNWLGHNQFGKAPHVFELTRDKKVAWGYKDDLVLKTTSSLQLLDIPGNAITG
jgi:hypothetical protein